MFFSRNTISSKPPVWALDDMMPELQAPLTQFRHTIDSNRPRENASEHKVARAQHKINAAFAEVGATFEAFRPDFDYFTEQQSQTLRQQHQAPTAEGLTQALEMHDLLVTEVYRVATLSARMETEFYSVDAVRDFNAQNQHMINKAWQDIHQVWDNIALDEQTIRTLSAQNPIIAEHSDLLRAPPPAQDTQSHNTPSSPQQTLPEGDVRLENYRQLYAEVTQAPMSDGERLQKATDMFNALTYQVGQDAAQHGLTTSQVFERSNNLPDGFTKEIFDASARYAASVPSKSPSPIDRSQTGAEPHYSWKEAADIVTTAFDKFHPEMGEVARMAFQDGWIHARATPEKFSNADSLGTLKPSTHPANHPYLHLNFDGSQRSVETLAHELGHAAVQYLEGEKSNDSLRSAPLHETFAHFAALLAVDEAIGRAPTTQEKQNRLNIARENTHSVIGQNQYQHFEYALHERARERNYEPFSSAELGDMVREAYNTPPPANAEQRTQLDQQQVMSMAGIMHFTHQQPHYSASYPLAELSAQSLLEKYKQEGPQFAEKWVNVMRHAPQVDYKGAMDYMGVDTSAEGLVGPSVRQTQRLDGAIQQAEHILRPPSPSLHEAPRQQDTLNHLHNRQDMRSAISALSQTLQQPQQTGNNASQQTQAATQQEQRNRQWQR